jgi:hypothetical protein
MTSLDEYHLANFISLQVASKTKTVWLPRQASVSLVRRSRRRYIQPFLPVLRRHNSILIPAVFALDPCSV